MKNPIRFSVVSAASVLALLLSASAFLLVGAQEPTPTETLEPSATETASETPVPSETPTAEASSPTAEASATETATSEFTATETGTETATGSPTGSLTATETPSVTPTPELPEGLVQPLVFDTNEALWCPATVASPQENTMGCTAPYTELSLLALALATAQPNVDGTIWIGEAYAGTADATFSSGIFPVTSTRKLTFKGAWEGPGGTIGLDVSLLAHVLTVTGWGNEVALSNLVIDGGGGDNLAISTNGKITLTNIESTDADAGSAGAVLDNTSGAADVLITGGEFHANTDAGLIVYSDGAITLSNVSVHSNGVGGAVLDNDTAAVPKPISVTNNSAFNSNTGDGLSVSTDGNITLTAINATFNTGNGVYLIHPAGGATTGNFSISSGTFSNNGSDGLNVTSNGTITVTTVTASSNAGVGIYLSNLIASAAKNVSLAGTNQFNSNGLHGLSIQSKGAIALNNVTANFNGLTGTCCNGAFLDNDNGPNPGMGVTITGSNVFSGNYNSGFTIESYGPVNLNNVIANLNLNGKGADIENASATTAQGVTITGSNQFSSNEIIGLEITTKGAVMLNNISANATQAGSGVTVSNLTGTADVTISGGTISGNIPGIGLGISTNGAVTLSNMAIDTNFGDGVQVDNDAAATPKNVTITNVMSNDNNGLGFNVETDGSMMVSGATANNNSSFGAYFHHDSGGPTASNCSFSSSTFNNNGSSNLDVDCNGNIMLMNVKANGSMGAYGAYLYGFNSSAVKNVTLTGANEFNSNWNDGLVVLTKGAIAVNDVTANFNGVSTVFGNGAYLQNDSGPNPGMGITLTGTNVFSGNYDSGLITASNGPIKANNVIANSNLNESGAILDNSLAATAQGVTLTGTSQFSYNDFFGLDILSSGAVMANNITANANGEDGANVDNGCGCTSAGVTFTGTNTFLENDDDGLDVYSFGAIAISNLTADDNGVSLFGSGLYADNSDAATPQKVTLSGVNSTSNNGDINLYIISKGAIAVNSVTANGSITGNGIDLSNNIGLTNSKQPITLTGTNAANDNAGFGVYAASYGAITLSSVTANDNSGQGAYVANDDAATPMAVTINGTNSFNDNTALGLEVKTDGAIMANNVTADDNGGWGVKIGQPGTPYASGVTFIGVNSFDLNGAGGLQITTFGAIAISSASANGNLLNEGIYLDNQDSTPAAPKNVTLSGVNAANNNEIHGVFISTYGDVMVNSLTASGNGVGAATGAGAYIDNSNGTIMKKVTLTGSNIFNDNLQDGLSIFSRGPITASNLSASGNDANGASFNNVPGTAYAGVTLTGTNTFNANANGGIQIASEGPIAASNLYASGNLNGGFAGVALSNVLTDDAHPQKVTVSGISVVSGNAGLGMAISSKGAVIVNSLTANANDVGLDINNTAGLPGIPQAVMLTGTNVFTGATTGYGLEVDSYGPISLANVTASNSTNDGANLDNLGATLPQNVTFTGVNVFNNNAGDGVEVDTKGAITSATSLTANSNTVGAGMNLSNANAGSTAEINLKGTNIASNNRLDGLSLSSFGAVTVNNVAAKENGLAPSFAGYGLYVSNASASPVKDVKMTGTNVLTGNYDANLYIESAGAITINAVTANASVAGEGANITNTTEGKAVTITGTNYFNDNSIEGLDISSLGAITTNNISANRNGNTADGAHIDNTAATTPRAVTMNGTNVFIDNMGQGLEVRSDGIVTLSNLHAHYNGDDGIYVQNDTGAAAVTLSGLNYFRHNIDNGVEIYSNGAVTVNKTIAEDNDNDGLFVDNLSANITLLCGTYTNNTGSGVDIQTNTPGVKKLVGIFASGNGTPPQIGHSGTGTILIVRNCP